MEFEVNGVWIHKDFAVVVAEAVHTINRILSTHIISESEISKIRVHVALVNNAHIRLGILRPLYNHESNCIIYIYDQDIKCFEKMDNTNFILLNLRRGVKKKTQNSLVAISGACTLDHLSTPGEK